jgi:hypothetical protein
MKAGSELDVIKIDGLMHKLKYEVDLMAQMVTNMDQFTGNQTRLVVVVDGLDSCEQDKVLQVLDTIKTLFCDEDSVTLCLPGDSVDTSYCEKPLVIVCLGIAMP